ncbi:MAG TPA: glutamate formimidoyltransferase [Gemmatimonadaceae bacterium]|nr:glutamate formimidoyltransferase [Gemmatimonadaceae bacterium]
MRLVECVPNFSEGRRADVIDAIRAAIAAVPGTLILGVSSDASHNRTVVTFAAPPEQAVAAALAGVREAARRIDLREHRGVHPRIGAADVVPFVPLVGTTMDDCIRLARALGDAIARELEIPVYLYGHAATREEHRLVAPIRRGGFERLSERIATDPTLQPDAGPARVHPSAGAVAVGARALLVAYNVYIGDASRLPIAVEVARAVRESSGGLPGVRALGLGVDGQAQVSMNLVDLGRTSIATAFEAVRREARARGADVTWSEIVGLVPERALLASAVESLQLRGFDTAQLLERRLRAAMTESGRPAGAAFLDAVSASTPTPGGGSAVAFTGALAAALAHMLGAIAGDRAARRGDAGDAAAALRSAAERALAAQQRLASLVELDARAYEAVAAAYRLPRDTAGEPGSRDAAIVASLLAATEVPLESARACAEVAGAARDLLATVSRSAASDLGVAVLLADAACRGAVLTVRSNVAALGERRGADAMLEAAESFRRQTTAHAAEVVARVEQMLGGAVEFPPAAT